MSDDKQITSENALFSREIIEKIFCHFNVKDLRRCAGVCWYWRDMAKKELSSRGSIESLILHLYITPYNHGISPGVETDADAFSECYGRVDWGPPPKDKEIDLTVANWHVSEAVRCVPKVFLVFSDDYIDTESPFCYEYINSLPKSARYADFAFLKMTVDGTELYAETNLCSGISIPSMPNLMCEMLIITQDDHREDDFDLGFEDGTVTHVVREILTNLNVFTATEEHYGCFILFLNRTEFYDGEYYDSEWRYDSYVNEFLHNVKRRFQPGTYSVFATGCTVITTSLNETPWLDWTFTFFLRIHGSALRSWSAVISLDLTMEKMKNELLNLKKKIFVNSSTIALCAVPVNQKNLRRGIGKIKNDGILTYFDPSIIFKQVFSSVTLTCVYDNEEYSQFGCNTLDNVEELFFIHFNSKYIKQFTDLCLRDFR